MTKRLYYDDACQTDFEARILERRTLQNGVGLVLDQTCFYPTSGGQPFDRGWLNDAPVLDVFEDGEAIVHVVRKDVPGDMVRGRVDWQRRADHIQQHTGQHILSAAFQQFGAATVSFHLGEEICTINLDRETLSAQDVARAEQLANQIVLENRPVAARFYKQEELAALPLRKPPTKSENIRIVAVRDFDYSPCGGTHFRSTGEVGPIKVRKWERSGQETRVEFLCGWRALHDYFWKHETIVQLANAFSVKDKEVAATVSRLAEEARAQSKELETLRKRLLDYEAEELSAKAPLLDGLRVIRQVFAERDAEEVRRLALRIIESGQRIVLFGIGGAKGRLVFARSTDAPGDMALLLREVCRAFGGGGGGQPHLAQGGGLDERRLEGALDFAWNKFRAAFAKNPLGGSKE